MLFQAHSSSMAHLDGWPCLQDSHVWQWASPLQIRHWCEADLILSKGSMSPFHKLPSSYQFLFPPWGTGLVVLSLLRGPQGSRRAPTTPAQGGICPTRKMTWIVELNSSGGHWRGRGPCLVLKLSGQALAGTGAFVMLSPSQHAAPSWQSTAFRRCYCCCFGCLVRNEKCSSAGRRLGGGTGCASTAAAFSRRAFHLLAAALDEAALGFLDPENELREDFPSQVLAAFVSQSKM